MRQVRQCKYSHFLDGIFLFKINSNTRTLWEICSVLTKKTLERLQWRLSGVLIANFEQISQIVLVFPSWVKNFLRIHDK